MKIKFTFDNITQLEELYYAVENIPSEILEDEKELGTPVKEEQQLFKVIMKLKSKLEEVHTTMEEEHIDLSLEENAEWDNPEAMEEESEDYNPEFDAASFT